MSKVFLLLGGNLGNRKANLEKTVCLIKQKIGDIIKYSSVYETEPWGFNDNLLFLNQVVYIETKLSPYSLISELQKIESSLGRKRSEKQWTSRVIDIDILFYDNIIINKKELKIPHPLIDKRRFVLVPLAEISENFVHPVKNKTIKELLYICNDKLKVERYNSASKKL
jgi:2-amino-4-hydroxy-6-hydroxymethyldihydropteridine diphosphokinase